MATREENLKKINAELEQLSDEELDQVAGGGYGETSDDGRFLYEYGLVDEKRGWGPTLLNWREYSPKVDAGWKKAGITCCTSPFGDNQYWVAGKKISRDEAYKIVKEKFQKVR